MCCLWPSSHWHHSSQSFPQPLTHSLFGSRRNQNVSLTSEKQKRFMLAEGCPVRVGASDGGETASWVTARDWETQQLSVSPARVACCLLRLIPQWNPSTNPIDGPPLRYQLKQNSLLTTGPSLVEQQDESLFWIFFSFFCREALSSSHALF